jgi:hypothetical protein
MFCIFYPARQHGVWIYWSGKKMPVWRKKEAELVMIFWQ